MLDLKSYMFATMMCMDPLHQVFFILISGAIFFELLGHTYRYIVYKEIQKQSLKKALYDRPKTLSPAEFGFLMNGKYNSDVYVSALIDLSLRGFVDISLDTESNKISIVLRLNPSVEPSKLEALLLKELKQKSRVSTTTGNRNGYSSYAHFEGVIEKSLVEKGWVHRKKRTQAEITGDAPGWMHAIVWFVTGSIVLLLLLGPYLESASWLLWPFGIFIFLSLFLVLFAFLGILLMAYMSRFVIGSRLSRRITKKYRAEFENLKGLAVYLIVSGMDTMTPDYQLLDFQSLDRLYPYAVSLGLDKKTVRLFRHYQVLMV